MVKTSNASSEDSSDENSGAGAVPELRRRVFFALWPDEAVRTALVQWRDAVQFPANVTPRAMAAWNLHITLVFLGFVSPAQYESAQAAADTVAAGPFTLRLDHYNVFPKAQVLFAAGHDIPPAAYACQQQLQDALAARGLRGEERPWSPHVTLFRKVRQLPAVELPTPVHWPVTEFCLVESISGDAGVQYQVRRRWPLDRSE